MRNSRIPIYSNARESRPVAVPTREVAEAVAGSPCLSKLRSLHEQICQSLAAANMSVSTLNPVDSTHYSI
ncbi:hypothetical protein [Methanomethylovorans sp.]|uniref:hypothetical protein n=1 Tax=Methanomethylovorans sp. TaxID=2758717 RepID=UPI00351C0869